MQKRRPYSNIAKNPEKLIEMLMLRRLGFSTYFLANLYGCDRETLRYHCRKYQIFPQKTKFISNSPDIFNPKRIATQVIIKIIPETVSNWVSLDGERVNIGKSYADYLKAEKLKRNSPYNVTV